MKEKEGIKGIKGNFEVHNFFICSVAFINFSTKRTHSLDKKNYGQKETIFGQKKISSFAKF
jgi:hypothetical protein